MKSSGRESEKLGFLDHAGKKRSRKGATAAVNVQFVVSHLRSKSRSSEILEMEQDETDPMLVGTGNAGMVSGVTCFFKWIISAASKNRTIVDILERTLKSEFEIKSLEEIFDVIWDWV